MANSLTLNIINNLSDRLTKGAKPAPKSYSASSGGASRSNGASSAKAVSLESLTSSLGAGSKPASNASDSRPASDAGKKVNSDYESAIKSLINKGIGSEKAEVSSSSQTSKMTAVPTKGKVGLDALIKTLGK
jgi:hypothetical protein